MTAEMPSRKRSIEKPVAVAVEGLDCFYTLLNQIKDDPDLQDVQLWDFMDLGRGKFSRWLSIFKTLEGFEDRVGAIGVIRDAEGNAAGMADSIKSAFEDNGFPVPTESMSVIAGRPALGFLLMPHGEDSGCLEHAVLQAASPDLPMQCVEQYLDCVENGSRNPNPNWRAKMKVHALIATGENPAWTLSESVRAGLWDMEHAALRVMMDFIRKLSRDAVNSG
ncbi:MAG: DUF3226 domain-containing protein [Planctomycetota bacterium]